jgi:hypothetical protein
MNYVRIYRMNQYRQREVSCIVPYSSIINSCLGLQIVNFTIEVLKHRYFQDITFVYVNKYKDITG